MSDELDRAVEHITSLPSYQKATQVAASDVERLVIHKHHLQMYQSKIKKFIDEEYRDIYSTETILKDMVYLLGISIDPKFGFANGYEEFKKELLKALDV